MSKEVIAQLANQGLLDMHKADAVEILRKDFDRDQHQCELAKHQQYGVRRIVSEEVFELQLQQFLLGRKLIDVSEEYAEGCRMPEMPDGTHPARYPCAC